MKTNICLIGFMLTGKSTVGKELAVRLGKDFVEMDAEIESLSGQPISELFQIGEEYFRDWEEKVCKAIVKRRNSVISCGGGIILRGTNIELLQKSSIIILLKAPTEVIYKRFLESDVSSRPLLKTKDPLHEIQKLYRNRETLYDQNTEIHINAANPITKIVDDIINKLQKMK